MSTLGRVDPGSTPESRWRRTVDRRGRPSRLTVSRLLRDFGFSTLEPKSQTAIRNRLAEVGLAVAPPLESAELETIVTLYAADARMGEPESRDDGLDVLGETEREFQLAYDRAREATERIASLERQLAEHRADKEALLAERQSLLTRLQEGSSV